MLWLRLTGNALPPGIGSCLERLTTPAIALIKLAGFDVQVYIVNRGEIAETPR